jgi:DNA-directed RNA polymerase subunit RPC12/RpoP
MAGRCADDYDEFEENPKCDMCGSTPCSLRWSSDAQLLVVTCMRCGYARFMQPLYLELPEDEDEGTDDHEPR